MFSEYSALLRHNPNYRRLWIGYVISQLGDWFNLIASASLVAKLSDDGQGTALSLLFLARFIPLFVMSPFAGVISDRFDRRKVMIASNIVRAATVLGFLLIQDADQLWLFYLLIVVQFSMTAMFIPARTALIANIVAKKDIITANALDSLTWSTMLALGALLGGLATAAFGITTAFILDSLTFLLSAWFFVRISAPSLPSVERSGNLTVAARFLEIIGGLQYLLREPLMLVIALVKSFGSIIYGAINVLEPTFAENVFPLTFTVGGRLVGEGGSLTLALMYTVVGVGTGLGPIYMRRWLGDSERGLRRGITISFFLFTFGIIMMGIPVNLPWFLTMSFIRTVGTGTAWVFSAALLQLIVPDEVRGRVFAFEFAVLTLAQSISIYWAGAAQDVINLSIYQTTLYTGFAGIIVVIGWLVFQFRTGNQPLTQSGRLN